MLRMFYSDRVISCHVSETHRFLNIGACLKKCISRDIFLDCGYTLCICDIQICISFCNLGNWDITKMNDFKLYHRNQAF